MPEDLFSPYLILEIVGAAFGVVQVLLSRKNNVNNYLFGIAGILIGMWIYYHSRLYADILLNMYYLVMSVYGWFHWKFGGKKRELPISYADSKDYTKAIAIAFACFGVMYYWLSSHTDSDVPIWDSLLACLAWAGMWLMANRKIENWLFLSASNLVAIPLLIYKGLFVYAALTTFLLIVGISGYFEWKKLYGKNSSHGYSTD